MVGLVEVEVVLRVVDLGNEISIVVLQLRSMPFSIFIPIYEVNLLISRGIPCECSDILVSFGDAIRGEENKSGLASEVVTLVSIEDRAKRLSSAESS